MKLLTVLLFLTLLLACTIAAADDQPFDFRDELRHRLRQVELDRLGAPPNLAQDYLDDDQAELLHVADLPHRSKQFTWAGGLVRNDNFRDHHGNDSWFDILGSDKSGRLKCRWVYGDVYSPFWGWSPQQTATVTAVAYLRDETDETDKLHVLELTEFVLPANGLQTADHIFTLKQAVAKHVTRETAYIHFMGCRLEVAEDILMDRIPDYVAAKKRRPEQLNEHCPSAQGAGDFYLVTIEPDGKDVWSWSAVLPFDYDGEKTDPGYTGERLPFVMLFDKDGWRVGFDENPRWQPGPYPGTTKVSGTLKSQHKPVEIDVYTPHNVAGA